MSARHENFEYLTNLNPVLRKIFDDAYKEKPLIRDSLYNVVSSSGAAEYDLTMSGFDVFTEFTGTLASDEIYQGYRKQYTHREYGKRFGVERKLLDDDEYNIIAKKPKAMGKAARYTQNQHAAAPINNAFNTTYTVGDTLALCSNSHTTTAGSDTFDNLGTTALSPSALETARQAMRAFKNDRSLFIETEPDMLIVPPELEQTALEITQTDRKVDTNYWNVNTLQGKFKVYTHQLFTDSNNWFLVDSSAMKDMLTWFDRVPLEFFEDKEFNTLQRLYGAYMRYSFGCVDWRWVYGSQVS